jgi:NADH:ubiquinone oxidoreductase subunit E
MFTLIELECLGSCGTAPVALMDEQLQECLTPEAIVKAIDDIYSGKHSHAHH